MAFDRFLIAPINTGLQQDLRPWLIPDDAFERLENMYVFRGRIRKRFGGRLMASSSTSLTAPLLSRLRVQVGTTDGAGNAAGTVPGHILKVGQAFSIGNEIFTVFNPAAGPQTMLDTGASLAHTFDLTTGNFAFIGAAHLTAIYYYPGEPVMGLANYKVSPLNNQPSYAFDTEFAYVWNGGWSRTSSGIAPLQYPVFHGTNIDFFWVENWRGPSDAQTVLFVTNDFIRNVTGPGAVLGMGIVSGLGDVTDDPIWTFFKDPVLGDIWSPFSFNPGIGPNNQPITVTTANAAGDTITSYVQSARIIVAFKDRLLLLNTIENNANGAAAFPVGITPATYTTSTNTQFKNRVRYSHNGSPFANNAWLEPDEVYNPGGALPNELKLGDGADKLDAPTEEEIVSAEFIKDRLIVFFERSTWELVYTGNEVLPFRWQKINTELGSEATFSTVPFDKVILTMGTTGVHACTGANVERIDYKIPDTVFQIRNKNVGVERVAGIRDYFVEMTYWTFPSSEQQADFVYPTRVLVYNYKNGAWAINTDCITVFGYFQQQSDITWASTTLTWEEYNAAWISGVIQAQFRQVIAGNQQGYVFIVDPEESRNAPVMQITDIVPAAGVLDLVIIDHTLSAGEYIAIENAQGVTGLNDQVFQIMFIDIVNNIVTIQTPTTFSGTYTGGGTVTRVSNYSVLSKEWNPYISKCRNVYLAKIDFCTIPTSIGQVTIDYYPSATELSMVQQGRLSGSILGDNTLETFPQLGTLETFQNRLWHPVYFQSNGEFIQIFIAMSDAQIRNIEIAFEDFEIEGMILFTQPTDYRTE